MVVVGSGCGGDIQIPASVFAASCSHYRSVGRRRRLMRTSWVLFPYPSRNEDVAFILYTFIYFSLQSARVMFKPGCLLRKSPNLINLVILAEW